MAASLRGRGIGSVIGERFISRIWTGNARHGLSASAPASRRAAHGSAYDKNPDEQVRPAIVPDEAIQPQSDKYWAPHPQTGVFEPATEPDPNRDDHPSKAAAAPTATASEGDSVLEQKAWYRPTSIEDLEKPVHH